MTDQMTDGDGNIIFKHIPEVIDGFPNCNSWEPLLFVGILVHLASVVQKWFLFRQVLSRESDIGKFFTSVDKIQTITPFG